MVTDSFLILQGLITAQTLKGDDFIIGWEITAAKTEDLFLFFLILNKIAKFKLPH